MIDLQTSDFEFAKRLDEIHRLDVGTAVGDLSMDTSRGEMLAMFDTYLGREYDAAKRERVIALQGKLHAAQAVLMKSLESGRLDPNDYVSKFNQLLAHVFQACQAELGKRDFEALFGAPASEMQGFIDLDTFLQEYRARPSSIRKTGQSDQTIARMGDAIKGLTVLIVDDSKTDRSALASMLKGHVHDVVVAEDGWDALERLGSRIPDLMLVDVMMPRMDGFELVQIVHGRPRTQNLPVVMMTSSPTPEREVDAVNVGATLLTKPFQWSELLLELKGSLPAPRPHAAHK